MRLHSDEIPEANVAVELAGAGVCTGWDLWHLSSMRDSFVGFMPPKVDAGGFEKTDGTDLEDLRRLMELSELTS